MSPEPLTDADKLDESVTFLHTFMSPEPFTATLFKGELANMVMRDMFSLVNFTPRSVVHSSVPFFTMK